MNENEKYFYSKDSGESNDKVKLPRSWMLSRLTCLFLAIGIWIYVVNITTQDFEQTFSLVDIQIDGWEQLMEKTNMSVVNVEESKISITVKGLRSDISKLTEADFRAYIDVSNLTESGKHDLEVSVNLPSTVSLVSKFPESVTISIDENIEREIPIDIELTEYNIDTIYELGTPIMDKTMVVVKGPSEVLNRVKSAKAYINLGTVMTSTVIRTEIVLVDIAGNRIDDTYLTFDTHGITVTVPVTMEKIVKLSYGFADGLDPNLYEPIKIEPSAVVLKGDPKILNQIESLNVYTVKGGENEKVLVKFDPATLPAGVEIINQPEDIELSIKLKPEPLITEAITEADTPSSDSPDKTES